MSGIYVASKSKHGPMWLQMRATGLPIISTWIDECGEGQTTDWADLWTRAIQEASSCSALVLYVPEEDMPKGGCYAETGAALGAGRLVFAFVPGEHKPKLLQHPLVTLCGSLEGAIVLARLAIRAQGGLNKEVSGEQHPNQAQGRNGA